jgi:hypothetical protein
MSTTSLRENGRSEEMMIIISCNTTSSQCYADYFCGGVTNGNGAARWDMNLTSALARAEFESAVDMSNTTAKMIC